MPANHILTTRRYCSLFVPLSIGALGDACRLGWRPPGNAGRSSSPWSPQIRSRECDWPSSSKSWNFRSKTSEKSPDRRPQGEDQPRLVPGIEAISRLEKLWTCLLYTSEAAD